MLDPNVAPLFLGWTAPQLSRRLLLALGLSLVVSCATAPTLPAAAVPPAATVAPAAPAAEAASQHSKVLVPNPHAVRRMLTDYANGPYFDEVAGLYAEAHAILAQKKLSVETNRANKNAVVLDIDETSLSNLQMYRLNDFGGYETGPCDLVVGPCSVSEWFTKPLGKPIPSAVEFVRQARAWGISVFFITGRRERTREVTEQNLRAAGFEWQELILKPNDFPPGSAADFKAPARRRLEAEGYHILLNIGDQESDLLGGAAEVTLKLPNPFYFIP